VLREILHNPDRLIASLSESIADDICDTELIIIAGMSQVMDARDPVELISELLPAGPTFGQWVDGLISKGYLRIIHPDDPGRTKIIVTERGQRVYCAVRKQLRIGRWIDFPMRSDDIVISTYPKSGTTWLQMICALLIFQTAELPAPLQELSPWIDDVGNERGEVFAALTAQGHRRFIKTHLPLGEIPVQPGVTYIAAARDPLDALLSYFQMLRTVRLSAAWAGDSKPRVPEAPSPAMLRDWMDDDATSLNDFTLPNIMRHLADAWDRRTEPNVLLLHFEALSQDLDGEMHRLADLLGITVPAVRWPGLVEAATFEQMRAAAGRLQPNPRLDDPATFFRSGRSGLGAKVIAAEVLAEYRECLARLARPDLLGWLQRDRPPNGPDAG
jgi:aryl sulfotransferase